MNTQTSNQMQQYIARRKQRRLKNQRIIKEIQEYKLFCIATDRAANAFISNVKALDNIPINADPIDHAIVTKYANKIKELFCDIEETTRESAKKKLSDINHNSRIAGTIIIDKIYIFAINLGMLINYDYACGKFFMDRLPTRGAELMLEHVRNIAQTIKEGSEKTIDYDINAIYDEFMAFIAN